MFPLALAAQTATKIGWSQIHIEGSEDYYVDYCDDIKCYAEFGFNSPFFKNMNQFYFFKKDSKDAAKIFFVATSIEYTESFNNWHIYYLNGISLSDLTDTAANTSYTMMLQTYDIDQWKNDSIPTLIQVYPITESNKYSIFTFEPKQKVDTINSSYTATKQRAIELDDTHDLKDLDFFILDDTSQFKLHFYHNMLTLKMQKDEESWLVDEKLKFFQQGHWKYMLTSTDLTSSDVLMMIFPLDKNWKNAVTGDLESVKIWTSSTPNILSEIQLQ